jgi:hypothetical protein
MRAKSSAKPPAGLARRLLYGVSEVDAKSP